MAVVVNVAVVVNEEAVADHKQAAAVVVIALVAVQVQADRVARDNHEVAALAVAVRHQSQVAGVHSPSIALRHSVSQISTNNRVFQACRNPHVLNKPRVLRKRRFDRKQESRQRQVRHKYSRNAAEMTTSAPADGTGSTADRLVSLISPE